MSQPEAPVGGGGGPDIPEKQWHNPFAEGTPMHDLFGDVLSQERDIIVIVDDYWGRRGTGKTIASLDLGVGMDQTSQGMTHSKASLEPEQIRNAYTREEPGSALVLDEGEVGASNRDPMSNTNRALREIMSMGRVEKKYVIVNTPIKSFIDTDIRKLADVWISMTRKGRGLVHFLEWEPYSEQLLTPTKQWLEFEDIERGTELRDIYNELTAEKREKMDGGGNEYIQLAEHEEELEKARKSGRKERRDEIVRGLFDHPEIQDFDISQRMVAEAIGVSQKTVSNILRDE